jgi:hypothetical protein
MGKPRHAVWLLALTAAGCDSSAPSNSAPQRPSGGDESAWLTFSSAEGGFSIKFPEKPTEQDAPTSAGIPRRLILAPLYGGQLVYSVQYADGPPSPDVGQSLVESQAAAVRALGGTLIHEQEIRLGDWHGREFSLTFTTRGAPGLQHTRVYRVDRRLFVLTVAGHPDRVNERDARQFFESFSLVDN